MSIQTICPSCDLPCERLVIDAEGTPNESLICVRCHACTEVIAADPDYLTDPKYNLSWIGESVAAYMRRMHRVMAHESLKEFRCWMCLGAGYGPTDEGVSDCETCLGSGLDLAALEAQR